MGSMWLHIHPSERKRGKTRRNNSVPPSTAHRGAANDWTATTASDRVSVGGVTGAGIPCKRFSNRLGPRYGTAHHGCGARPTKPLPIARVRVRF